MTAVPKAVSLGLTRWIVTDGYSLRSRLDADWERGVVARPSRTGPQANTLTAETAALIGKDRRDEVLSERARSASERDWWTWSGSNRRPLPCHGSALPAAPQAHCIDFRARGGV